MTNWEEVLAAPAQLLALADTMRGNDERCASAANCSFGHRRITNETRFACINRLVLPFERHMKGEEDKPLPLRKPRKPYKRNLDGKINKAEGKGRRTQFHRQIGAEVPRSQSNSFDISLLMTDRLTETLLFIRGVQRRSAAVKRGYILPRLSGQRLTSTSQTAPRRTRQPPSCALLSMHVRAFCRSLLLPPGLLTPYQPPERSSLLWRKRKD